MIGRLRLYSGLVLFTYVTGHLLNHMVGIVSLDAMNALNRYMSAPWRSLPGTILLSGALVLHVALAFYGLYARRRLTLRRWEIVQLLLGLAIPMLLAAHVFGTRITDEIVGLQANYSPTLAILWVLSPVKGVLQALGLLAAWGHGCIGLHMWLRLKPSYARWRGLALSLAVLFPALALAGYVAAGMEVRGLALIDGWVSEVLSAYGRNQTMAAFTLNMEDRAQAGVITALIAVFVLRFVRQMFERRRQAATIRYAPGDMVIPLVPGGTALEAIRAAGIPHTSVCGGRGRCSTCRVRIGRGLENLPPPEDGERRVLNRLGFEDDDIRLACQLRPQTDLTITALLPQEDVSRGSIGHAHDRGDELEMAILFVDLRGSTRLSEERLPFDVVFVLNQFFAELSAALDETDGHYAQFNGDGLMALYGLDAPPEQACRSALRGATAMLRRIEALSERLSGEISEPLRVGIGIHFGEAIVGSMGPPATPIVSALGDNVNIAARLESMTKDLGVELCVSARTLETAGIDIDGYTIHELPVKGRERPIRVVAFEDPPAV